MSTVKKEEKFLMYKGFPLVRCGDIIYYGNLSDKYVIMMQISESSTLVDIDIAKKVTIQLQYTDPDLKAKDRVLKTAEKKGLYEAMDIDSVCLERALHEK